jgi:phosphotransferase system IIB component
MAYSKWINNTGDTMEQIIQNISDYQNWYEPNIDELTGLNLGYSIEFVQQSQNIQLGNNTIEYSIIKYEFEKHRPGENRNTDRAIRVKLVKNYILIFRNDDKIQYIINRNGPDAKAILRKLNNHTSRNTITENKFDFSQDLFNWLIYVVLKNNNPIINTLEVKKIMGFKGTVDQKEQRLAEIIGSGSEIMNALSTLAFLFDNDGMIYIKPVIKYNENHTSIEIDMRLNGTLDINSEVYMGDFKNEPEDIRKAKILLLLNILVLPDLITAFNGEVENEKWNLDIQVTMIKEIGEIIQGKVKEKIQSLVEDEGD